MTEAVVSSPLEVTALGRFPLVELELGLVDPPGERLRFGLNEEKVVELMLSIGEKGVLQPPGVRAVDGRYQVVWGDHRTEALRRLGRRRAEFFVVQADADEAVLLSATENLQRHDMSPVEEGAACGRLCSALGDDVDAVASRLKRSRAWVESRLLVLGWPEDVQLAVHEGRLSRAAGAELSRVSDGVHRRFLLEHATDGNASARTCMAWRIAWEQTGVADTSSVAQVGPGRTVPPPVEAELPCYFCGDREPYGRLTHIWLCPEGLEMFAAFREAYHGRGVVPVGGAEIEPEAPGGGLRRGA